MFSGSNVLVAGGAGFVGINLINRLLLLEANIRATVHRRDPVILNGKIEYIKCDLTKMADCERVVSGMDYVFLCAANSSGAAVMQFTPLVHVTPNIVMNSQMLEAAYYARVKKFVWISSCAAYPPSGDKPITEDELFDGEPYDKYYPVAWMKRYTEILCKMYSEKLANSMLTVILRPSNIFGPYDDFDFSTSHVMAALIRKVIERMDPLEVWGTGDDVRDWIYIEDFIDAMVLATGKIESYTPINIALGEGYSIKEVLQLILEIDGYNNADIQFNTSNPTMISSRLVDTSRAKAILGFEPKIGLGDGIQKTSNWYRSEFLADGDCKQSTE